VSIFQGASRGAESNVGEIAVDHAITVDERLVADGPVDGFRVDDEIRDEITVDVSAETDLALDAIEPEALAAPEPRRLRRLLFLADAVAVLLAWLVVMVVPPDPPLFDPSAQLAVLLAATIVLWTACIAAMRLYLARVARVRTVEVARLAWASCIAGGLTYLLAKALGLGLDDWRLAAGAAAVFVLVAFSRAWFGAWLKALRATGRYVRPIVIVGTNDEARTLLNLLETHPELGYRVAGVVGRRGEHSRLWPTEVAWLGTISDTTGALQRVGADGVFVATSAVSTSELNCLTRRLPSTGVHVHLSSGLIGISSRRLRSAPLAHEPMFYVETTLAPWQFFAKRTADIVVASIMLLATSWILVLAAIAIKLQDRGPVLFRQRRVGRDAKTFDVLKLRTMVPDAEGQVDQLRNDNERVGPLFKITDDPRRTRIGRILERTSIDELPQLVNVLRGEMSLVGPRPALPAEADQFDEELNQRHNVAPGITGLWQVEARDNPSFGAYRRLDIFYVENWSITMDLSIMLATAKTLVMRALTRKSGST